MSVLFNVIFDSITNSVFAGQIYEPLVRLAGNDVFARAYLVSFESRDTYDRACGVAQKLSHKKIKVIILRRYPFISCFFLRISALKLKKVFEREIGFGDLSEIIARGPLAAVVCQYALKSIGYAKLTIQARGLLAQEYLYTHKGVGFFKKLFHRWRAYCYKRVERQAYGKLQPCAYQIESVSEALSEYLCESFSAIPEKIFLAMRDTPPPIEPGVRAYWRAKIRMSFGIAEYAKVYCFCGSALAWQQPDLVIKFFCEQSKKERESFLFILSSDKEVFERQTARLLSSSSCAVLRVSHAEVFLYLCAADFGLIFREKNIINFVSRPVKAMEYEAAGLTIVHNNTVDWIVSRHGQNELFDMEGGALV